MSRQDYERRAENARRAAEALTEVLDDYYETLVDDEQGYENGDYILKPEDQLFFEAAVAALDRLAGESRRMAEHFPVEAYTRGLGGACCGGDCGC